MPIGSDAGSTFGTPAGNPASKSYTGAGGGGKTSGTTKASGGGSSLGINTGKTIYGNTAIKTGNTSVYATRNKDGSYSNLRDWNGNPIGSGGSRNSGGGSSSTGSYKKAAPTAAKVPAKKVADKNAPPNAAAAYAYKKLAQVSPQVAKAIEKQKSGYTGPKLTGFPGGYGIQAWESRYRRSKQDTSRVKSIEGKYSSGSGSYFQSISPGQSASDDD